MIKIGILGATGYTALELIKILLRHPHAEIVRLTSRSEAGTAVDQCHTSLRGQITVPLVEYELEDFCSHVDFAFSCLPHAAASPIVKQLVDRGIKTVDFSADYRLNDLETYNRWYKSEHADPERVGQTAYGLPELFADQIQGATLVANPGCFPTSCLLPLAPLFQSSLIDPDDIVIDSKTGVSGGGRKAKLNLHFPECNESVSAYAIGTHRHAPEVDHIIERFSETQTQVIFTPHLIPMTRGILSTIYARPNRGVDAESLHNHLVEFYRDSAFVRVSRTVPVTADVRGTNFCDISVQESRGRIVIVCAIDNLIKGASGAAVQNFNLMQGFEQTTGLL